MNKKLWILISVVILALILIVATNWGTFFPYKGLSQAENQSIANFKDSAIQKDQAIPDNDWKFFASIVPGDSLNILKVVYQEKYGSEKTIYCTAVFENDKTGEYKCIAPWLPNCTLQQSNLNSFNYQIVLKKGLVYSDI